MYITHVAKLGEITGKTRVFYSGKPPWPPGILGLDQRGVLWGCPGLEITKKKKKKKTMLICRITLQKIYLWE